MKQCLPKRIDLLDKIDSDHEPSSEELNEAYGILR